MIVSHPLVSCGGGNWHFPLLFSLYEVSAAGCPVPPSDRFAVCVCFRNGKERGCSLLFLAGRGFWLLPSSQKYSCGKEAEECACDRGGRLDQRRGGTGCGGCLGYGRGCSCGLCLRRLRGRYRGCGRGRGCFGFTGGACCGPLCVERHVAGDAGLKVPSLRACTVFVPSRKGVAVLYRCCGFGEFVTVGKVGYNGECCGTVVEENAEGIVHVSITAAVGGGEGCRLGPRSGFVLGPSSVKGDVVGDNVGGEVPFGTLAGVPAGEGEVGLCRGLRRLADRSVYSNKYRRGSRISAGGIKGDFIG